METDEILERMFLSPKLNYAQIVEQQLLTNLCGVHEIARIRKLFRDNGSKAFEGQWNDVYKNPKFKVTVIDGIAFGSHCNNPDPRYAWTSDYIGYAPQGHPAEGHLIFAKIEGLTLEEETRNPLAILNGPSSQGAIRISREQFAICDEYHACRRYHNAQGNFLDAWIEDFEEKNGIIVPVLSKVVQRKTWSPAHTVHHGNGCSTSYGPGYTHQTFQTQYDPKGFGPLRIDLDTKRPIAARPGSWLPGTGFNSSNGTDSSFFAFDAKVLMQYLTRNNHS